METKDSATNTRASQKLNLTGSPHRRKRHSTGEEDLNAGVPGFCSVIHRSPPAVPPALLRRIGVREVTGVGKVKVMLRVCGTPGSSYDATSTEKPAVTSSKSTATSFFSVDGRKKQVTLFDPAACGASSAPEDRRVGVAAPKMFAFDAIFTQDDSQSEVCSCALTDVIHAVINGTDGCLFCFGHARLGKTNTMLGSPDSSNSLGVIPCAISWLFRGINEQKQKTGARFSVRVSAVELTGPANLKDLLAGHANDSEQSPGVYLRDDPLFGTQLQNQSELRVPTAEKAAYYLDAAVNSRGSGKDDGRDSHLLYTLHVYQYSVAGKGGVAGGRSRLHLIDLGSCERGKANGGIPLSGLGNVLLAIFNGQKHLPYREHKVTQLLKECLSSLTCHAAMIAHVSPFAQHYTDTLSTVQLASRIHRMRRRKFKFTGGSAGSGGSSGEEAARLQAHHENGRSTGSSDVDPSSSEQSADTVIYVGPSDDATDGEHPPVYIPSLNSGDNRCSMSKALRGSGAEHRPANRSNTSSPAKSATSQQKLGNGTGDSPKHRAAAQVNTKSVGCKSSPVRTPGKTSAAGKDQPQQCSLPSACQSSKIPVPFTNGVVSGSDEQWIDGPRISKSKVVEARNLLKDSSHKKKETWIDGPLQVVKGSSNPVNGQYGFMDNHKKSMIRKWVENQTVQIQKQNVVVGTKHIATPRPPTTGGSGSVPPPPPQPLTYKELTVFKTCDEEDCKRRADVGITDEHNLVKSGEGKEDLCLNEGLTKPSADELTSKEEKDEVDVENGVDGMEEVAPVLAVVEPQQKELSPDVSIESLDMEPNPLQERREAAGAALRDAADPPEDYGEEEDYEEEYEVGADEIMELEEVYEAVPMQDSCLQVTEEDIALCMGVLQLDDEEDSSKEHPLRILSEENLTVVSTFTDSMSVTTDLDRALNRHRLGLMDHTFLYPRPNSLYDYPDKPIDPHGDMLSSQAKFDQLARLHEMYKTKLAQANLSKQSPSRCQSLSLSDMLYGAGPGPNGGSCGGGGSIYSEPAYNPKFCDNCKISLSRSSSQWYQPPGHRFCSTRLAASGCNISSLRHPDGASNPNLKEEVERIPGNGASTSDHEEELERNIRKIVREDVRTVTGKAQDDEDDDELPPVLPPPLPAPSRLHRRLFGRPQARVKCEGYDSGHDATPTPQSSRGPVHRTQCESSGYESVPRDSECSSFGSSQDLDTKELHDPGGPKRKAVPVLQYCREDVERLERRWTEARGTRIAELRVEQKQLKAELAAAKNRLLIPTNRWSYELHVEASMDYRDPSFVEALERETLILRKRVEACKSHVIMVTCFDTVSKTQH